MGWGCYKHEWDADSEAWSECESNLCDRMLAQEPRTFGRDGRVCPACYEELEKRAACSAERAAALEELARVVGQIMQNASYSTMEYGERVVSFNGILGDDLRAAISRLEACR